MIIHIILKPLAPAARSQNLPILTRQPHKRKRSTFAIIIKTSMKTFALLVLLGLIPFAGFAVDTNSDAVTKVPDEDTLSTANLAKIKADSLTALRALVPPDLLKKPRTMKVVETKTGTVRWGNMFDPDEIVALVNLPPLPAEYPDYDPPQQYVLLYVWSKEKWRFRQFLGRGANLEIHYRKDLPSAFLQGSYKTGRYEGNFVSWYYESKSHLLKRTYFENWGPFHLADDYLVLERGYERRAHDETFWIYSYKKGQKGELLAVYHSRDDGHFEISAKNPASGKMEEWAFIPDDPSNPIKFMVVVADSSSDQPVQIGKGELTADGDGSLAEDRIFSVLTGLSPALLNSEWQDQLPPPSSGKLAPLRASGDAMVIQRLSTEQPSSSK